MGRCLLKCVRKGVSAVQMAADVLEMLMGNYKLIIVIFMLVCFAR